MAGLRGGGVSARVRGSSGKPAVAAGGGGSSGKPAVERAGAVASEVRWSGRRLRRTWGAAWRVWNRGRVSACDEGWREVCVCWPAGWVRLATVLRRRRFGSVRERFAGLGVRFGGSGGGVLCEEVCRELCHEVCQCWKVPILGEFWKRRPSEHWAKVMKVPILGKVWEMRPSEHWGKVVKSAGWVEHEAIRALGERPEVGARRPQRATCRQCCDRPGWGILEKEAIRALCGSRESTNLG
jgi:hypothetical protein